MSKTVPFRAIQFSTITLFCSLWPIDRTLSGTTPPGQSGPGSYGNEGVLRIAQSSSITGISPSDCLVSYPGYSRIYIYIYISSSSSYRAGSTDIPDPLSPLLPIVHRPSRSSGQHPVSSHSCWMYVRAGRPAFARPCVGIHKSTSLMSSSLLLQQCPACLVRLTWIDFVIGGRWPYSWCLVGCRCRTCWGLHAAFLCNCHLVSSRAVLLASM